jgi:flagellar protein FliS
MTSPNPAMRERYLADTISTASPAKLLVMLYDRLVLDLSRAEDALAGGDRTAASTQLMHAQDILLELRTSLDTEAWDGAPGLANLYVFIITELMQANMTSDAARVTSCRILVEPLRDAWREAALTTAAPVPAG